MNKHDDLTVSPHQAHKDGNIFVLVTTVLGGRMSLGKRITKDGRLSVYMEVQRQTSAQENRSVSRTPDILLWPQHRCLQANVFHTIPLTDKENAVNHIYIN